jgi:hypothetical protein
MIASSDVKYTIYKLPQDINAFYVAFSFEFCMIRNAVYYPHELREQVISILKSCVLKKNGFTFWGGKFNLERRDFFYQLLIGEIKKCAPYIDMSDEESVLQYINDSRKLKAANGIDKGILCVLHAVNIQEKVLNKEMAMAYNPLGLDFNQKNTIVINLNSSKQIVIQGDDHVGNYILLLKALYEPLNTVPAKNVDFTGKVKNAMSHIMSEFEIMLFSLQSWLAVILLKMLSLNIYEYSAAQQRFLYYHTDKVRLQLQNSDVQTSIDNLDEDTTTILMGKIFSFPFASFFHKFEKVEKLRAFDKEFSFAQHLDVNNLDVVFLRYKDEVSYSLDSIYYAVREFALQFYEMDLGRISVLKKLLIRNLTQCLSENLDDIVDYKNQRIVYNEIVEFEKMISDKLKVASSLYKMEPLAYIHAMIWYGPLDESAKIMLSVMIGMVIYEYDIDENYVKYSAPIGFPYSSGVIEILKDVNFSSNCSYYSPVSLDTLCCDNIAKILKEAYVTDGVAWSQDKHERNKGAFVKMFSINPNYQPYGKYLINCPVSRYSYLLPIMLACIKNKYPMFNHSTLRYSVNYYSLDNMEEFRQKIITFFFVHYKNSYEGIMDELVGIAKEITDKNGRIKYLGSDETLMQKYLADVDTVFPECLLPVVVDFIRLPIIVYDFVEKKSVHVEPKELAAVKPNAQHTIYLQSVGGNLNLLTDDLNWEVDHVILGPYGVKEQVVMSSKSQKNPVTFSQEIETRVFDIEDESRKYKHVDKKMLVC